MPHTKEAIVSLINVDEPDYSEIMKNISEDDIPVLIELSKEEDVAVAAKAVSCLSHFSSPAAISGLENAVLNVNPIIRTAVAHGLRMKFLNEPKQINLLSNLLDDVDAGVRKFALKSVATSNMKNLKEKVSAMGMTEKNATLKMMAEKVASELK